MAYEADPRHVELLARALGGGENCRRNSTSGAKTCPDSELADNVPQHENVMQKAVHWLERNYTRENFFLWIDSWDPHEPWDPLQRHLDQYEGRTLPERVMREGELDEKPPQHKAHREMHATTGHESVIDMYSPTEEDIDRMRRHYYAKITTVDEKLGHGLGEAAHEGLRCALLYV